MILETMRSIYDIERGNPTYKLLLLESVIRIWRSLYSLFPKQDGLGTDQVKVLKERRMKIMLHYIWQNYTQPLSIPEIAAAASISKSECFRCFSELSNLSPIEYLNQFRLLQASRLLTTTDKSISDICYETGFNSTSYFSKKFSEQYGMSPKAYRNTNQKH